MFFTLIVIALNTVDFQSNYLRKVIKITKNYFLKHMKKVIKKRENLVLKIKIVIQQIDFKISYTLNVVEMFIQKLL